MLLGCAPRLSRLSLNYLRRARWAVESLCDCVDVACTTVARQIDAVSWSMELCYDSDASWYSKLLRARLIGSSRLVARVVYEISEEFTSLVKVARMAIDIAEVWLPPLICVLLSTTTRSAKLWQTRLIFSCRQRTSLLVSL